MKFNRVLAVLFVVSMLFQHIGIALAEDLLSSESAELEASMNPDVKQLNPDGSVPAQWNLPKPKFQPHPDVAPDEETHQKTDATGIIETSAGDGRNYLSFSSFRSGDIAVGLGNSATGHAGEWDSSRYNGNISTSYCIWSALKNVGRVTTQRPVDFRNYYDRGYGLWVPSVSSYLRTVAKNYCAAQNGEPYVLYSSKSNTSAWYCSKLCWASYKYTSANKDLDADGGYWVWPVDLVNDNNISIFAYSN